MMQRFSYDKMFLLHRKKIFTSKKLLKIVLLKRKKLPNGF